MGATTETVISQTKDRKVGPCTVCQHKARHEIDILLNVEGKSLRDIARQYGLGKDALWRHRENGHIGESVRKAAEVAEVKQAVATAMGTTDYLAELGTLRKRAEGVLDSASDERTALSAIKEVRENYRLQAEIEGKLRQQLNIGVQVGVTSEAWKKDNRTAMLFDLLQDILASDLIPDDIKIQIDDRIGRLRDV